MEYVGENAELYELQKKVRSWERKVEIAEVLWGLAFTMEPWFKTTLESRPWKNPINKTAFSSLMWGRDSRMG